MRAEGLILGLPFPDDIQLGAGRDFLWHRLALRLGDEARLLQGQEAERPHGSLHDPAEVKRPTPSAAIAFG